jgi:hypothetical protein
MMLTKSGDYGLHWSSNSVRVAFGSHNSSRQKGSDAVKNGGGRMIS